jgi:Winged helix DNA-binding domain
VAADERVLTLRELNRALLERQLLLERRRLAVPRAVERVCAIQAQYSPSPYIGLWSRLQGFRKEKLTRALEERRVVKCSLFRVTLHIVSARDFPLFVALWLNGARSMFPRMSASEIDRFARRVRGAAGKRALTHDELRNLVPELGRMQWHVRALAPLVHEPPSGTWGFHGRPRLTTIERWLGESMAKADAGGKHFVRSYLAAFGPASREDIMRFAGARVRDIQPALDALEPLRRFKDEQGRLLFDLPRAPLPGSEVRAPIRFLPKWDSSLLAYAPPERKRILPEQFRRTVIKTNGDVLPTVLVDGFVAATWSFERKQLKVEPLRRLTRAERSEIDLEGERLVEFLTD